MTRPDRNEIYQLAYTRPSQGPAEDAERFLAAVEAADDREVIAAVAMIHDRHPGDSVGAFREAARAVLEARLTQRLVERMESLEGQAARLTKVGWIVSAVVAVAAVWVGRC